MDESSKLNNRMLFNFFISQPLKFCESLRKTAKQIEIEITLLNENFIINQQNIFISNIINTTFKVYTHIVRYSNRIKYKLFRRLSKSIMQNALFIRISN